MAETDSKQCSQCGFVNLSAAKFCIECGERFAAAIGANTAREIELIKADRVSMPAAKQAAPIAALDDFLGTQKSEEAAARLKSAVEFNRAKLKSVGVRIPRATNPLVVSLVDSLKKLPDTETSARIAIVTALGRTEDAAVLPPMQLVAVASAKEVRKAVAVALGNIRHPLSAYLLLPMLQDGSSRVRQSAFRSLFQIVQPHTVDSMLAACLCSKSLRLLIMETLQSATAEHRRAFFDMLASSDAEHESGTKLLADWLRNAFRDELTASALLPNNGGWGRQEEIADHGPVMDLPIDLPSEKTTLAVNSLTDSSDSCDVIEFVSPRPALQPKPAVWQNSTKRTVRESSVSDIFIWDNESSVYPGSSGRSVNGRGGRSSAVAQRSAIDPAEDDYEILNELLNDSDGSSPDMAFFNAITESFLDDFSEADVSGGSQTHTPSAGQQNREDAVAGSGFFRTLTKEDFATTTSTTPDMSSHSTERPPASSDDSSAGSGFFRALTEEEFETADGEQSPTASQSAASQPTFRTADASSAARGHNSVQAAPTNSVPAAFIPVMPTDVSHLAPAFSAPVITPPVNRVSMPPTESGLPTPPPSVSSISSAAMSATPAAESAFFLQNAAEDAAESAKRMAAERALERLRTAREIAFRELLRNSGETPTKSSASLQRKISALFSTPATDIETVTSRIRGLGESKSPQALEAIAAFSKKPPREIRQTCAETLGCIPDQGSAVLLLKFLTDKSSLVLEAALRSLITIGFDSTYPVILASGLCDSSLRTIVSSAVESAEADQKPGWEQFLLRALESGDFEVSAFAVSLLARLTKATHFEVYRRLVGSESPLLRAAAVEALVRTEEKRAIPHINESLIDPDPGVRGQAALAIATIHSPRSLELLSRLLGDDDLTVRRNAALSMSRIDEPDLADPVARALQGESDPVTVEYLLAASQRNGGKSCLPILTRYIQDELSPFREQALKALRKIRVPESVPLLVGLLDDRSPAIRRNSVEQLAMLKAEKALAKIREILKNDPDEFVRAACARAIGELEDKASLQLLEDALTDHAAVRMQAVVAMGRLQMESAVPTFLTLLGDSQPEIRYQAVKAIGAIKAENCAEHVERLLEDSDELVRRGAEQTLSELGIKSGSRRARQWMRRLSKAAGWIAPSSLAAVLPGGVKTLLVAVLLIAVSAGIFAFKGVLSAVGGEDFDIRAPISISVDGSGDELLVVRQFGVCEIWDIKSGELKCRQSLPGRVTGGLFASDSDILMKQGGKLIAYEAVDSELREKGQSLELPELPTHTVIHRKTQTLFVAYLKNNLSHLISYDLQTMKKTSDRALTKILGGQMTVSPDGNFVASMSGSEVVIFDLVNNQAGEFSFTDLTSGSKPGEVLSMSFSDDMRYLAISQSTYGVAVIELETTSVKTSLELKDSYGYSFVRFAKGSHDLIAVSSSGKVVVSTNEFTNTDDFAVEGCRSALDMFSVSDDNQQIAVGSIEELDLFIGDAGAKKMSHHLDPVDKK